MAAFGTVAILDITDLEPFPVVWATPVMTARNYGVLNIVGPTGLDPFPVTGFALAGTLSCPEDVIPIVGQIYPTGTVNGG